MPLTISDAQQVQGQTMVDSDGSKIGKISDIYIDNDTQQPEWALVSTGMFGSKETFVPLAQASVTDGSLRVPYSKDQIKDAPNMEPDGELSEQEESQLYSYYGLNYSESRSDSGLPSGGAADLGADGGAGYASGVTDTTATDTGYAGTTTGSEYADAGTTTGTTDTTDTGTTTTGDDQTITRSEERLRVGVQRRPSQTVRLSKHVVTENVSTTVPVTHEKLTVSREPIAEGEAGTIGAEIGEQTASITLTDEEPVVDKETVAVERIRLGKEEVTENQTVTGTVRKEVIDTDGDETV